MVDDPKTPHKRRLFWIEKMHGISDSLGEPRALSKWARYAFLMVAFIAISAVGLRTINLYTTEDSAAFTGEFDLAESVPEAAPSITVLELIGSAEFFGERQTWLPLRRSTALTAGDRVRTAAESYVTLQLLGQHLIRLDTETEIKLLAINHDLDVPDQSEISIFQRSGQAYHRTSEAGVSYVVSTPHLTVNVERGGFVTALVNEATRSTVRLVSGEGLVEWRDQALRLAAGDETSVDGDQTSLIAARTPLDFFKTPWMEVNRRADLALSLPLGRMADLTPPPLQITEPQNGAVMQEASVTIVGQSEVGAVVLIAGQSADVDGSGIFRQTIALQAGPNTIEIVATDASGNQNRVTLSLTYQPPEPVADAALDPASPALPDQSNDPPSTPLTPTAENPAPTAVTIKSLRAEVRPNGSVAVSWTSSDPAVLRYALAWSKTNPEPSRCSSDPEVSSVAVSATGYNLTGLSAGKWFIGVSPQQTGNNTCVGLKMTSIELGK